LQINVGTIYLDRQDWLGERFSDTPRQLIDLTCVQSDACEVANDQNVGMEGMWGKPGTTKE